MPGEVEGVAGSFSTGTKNLGILREIPIPGNCFLPKHRVGSEANIIIS